MSTAPGSARAGGGVETPPPALRADGIVKRYPGVLALDGVSLTVRPGTVHALVGENGAGKSTLVKVLTGAIAPDEGRIAIAGRPVSRLTPGSARSLGLSMIAQERQIAAELTVAENVLLGSMPRRGGLIAWRSARQEARRLLDLVGLDVDERRSVRGLGVAQLQAIEIARGLVGDIRLLFMDEPTSALGGGDVQRLFGTIRRLREAGVAIVYISHHLEEIVEVADVVTVLRDGRVVDTSRVAETSIDEIVAKMLGTARSVMTPPREAPGAASRRVVVQAEGAGLGPLQEASLTVREGEILAITGPVGSGRRELARLLAGVERPERGEVRIDGRRLGHPRAALRAGVAFLPEDRKREGMLTDLDITENIAVAATNARRGPLVLPPVARRRATQLSSELRVKAPSVGSRVHTLSGGNQQKVLLARWLGVGARVFVFDEPTAGIDIGAKAEIYGLIRDLAARGAAIVVCSSDFEEIRALARRVLVLARGRVAGELTGADITEESLLQLEWSS